MKGQTMIGFALTVFKQLADGRLAIRGFDKLR